MIFIKIHYIHMHNVPINSEHFLQSYLFEILFASITIIIIF